MIEWIDIGDIFSIQGVKNYAHGCNCSGAMGKGIALQFKLRYPEMYKIYKQKCAKKEFELGDVFEYHYGGGYIFNLGTQKSWRTKARIDAIDKSLNKMLLLAAENGVDKIALPKIGAGLGGLEWKLVRKVIEQTSNRYPDIELFVVENFKKAC